MLHHEETTMFLNLLIGINDLQFKLLLDDSTLDSAIQHELPGFLLVLT